MLQPNTNITSKYRQETRYNYIKNSGFWVSDCSLLLHYHYVNHANSCGNAIAKPPALLHAFVLSFRYHYTYRTNSCGNAITKPQALLHAFALSLR